MTVTASKMHCPQAREPPARISIHESMLAYDEVFVISSEEDLPVDITSYVNYVIIHEFTISGLPDLNS